MLKLPLILRLLTFSILLAAPIAEAAVIHLEHSYAPGGGGSSWGTEGGSSWGTDGGFREALTLPDNQIPDLYKLPAITAKPTFVEVGHIPLAAGRFTGDKVALYKKIRLCLDATLPQADSYLEEAKETFLDNVAGKKVNRRLLDLTITSVSTRADIVGQCDILAVQGSWSAFPYRYLPDNTMIPEASRLGKIYGLFYRWDDNSIPIITIHPGVQVSYSPPGGEYVTSKNGHLIVDGRVLLLHEVGHILGFAHIKPTDGAFDFPEATAMGIDSDYRDQRSLNLRFEFANNLWKYWDAYQTTVYRRVYQRELNPRCNLPAPGFVPAQGISLQDAVTRFNERLALEMPWGAYPLTADAVKRSVTARIKDIPETICSEFQSLLVDRLPTKSEILYHAGSRSCIGVDGSPKSCRYFYPRLYFPSGRNSSYSIGVDHDVTEKGSNP